MATLLARGFAVYAINPKQLDRFRDRHTAAGAKDDRRDAHVLADSLRTDQPAFRRVHVEDPLVLQLRELARLDKIAYIRFASVYRRFETPDDFREAVQEVKTKKRRR